MKTIRTALFILSFIYFPLTNASECEEKEKIIYGTNIVGYSILGSYLGYFPISHNGDFFKEPINNAITFGLIGTLLGTYSSVASIEVFYGNDHSSSSVIGELIEKLLSPFQLIWFGMGIPGITGVAVGELYCFLK